MKCAYHPEVDAVGACANCGRLVCAECKAVVHGNIYCNPCADKLLAGVLTTDRPKGLNWFEKHLNWTAVLSWIALYPIYFIVGFIFALIIYSVDPFISEESVDAFSYLLSFIVVLAWILPTNGWILRRKKRSLWWLLMLFVPIGWIVFLSLENQSHLPKLKIYEYEKEKEWAEFTALPEISERNCVGNEKTRIFHRPDCYQAQQIGYENAVWFESSADAIIEGYEPCELCNAE
jgi:hypothetical protein